MFEEILKKAIKAEITSEEALHLKKLSVMLEWEFRRWW